MSFAATALTFNIRLETYEPDPLDNWTCRRDAVLDFLAKSSAAIIGLQEVTPSQLNWLSQGLRQYGYEHVGSGRDASGGGEASPIFVKTESFVLLHHDTRWLSHTPRVPGSKFPGAGCPRVVTCAQLQETASQRELFVFCTHLDHHGMATAKLPFSSGLQVQQEQARILVQQIEDFCHDVTLPRVVLGDFNSWRSAGAHPVLLQNGYLDASMTSATPDTPTFVGFQSGLLRRQVDRAISVQIDWIFATRDLALSEYRVHTTTYPDTHGRDRNLSDHLPVSVKLSCFPFHRFAE
eukprot:TRINITY_DN21600_c0_g1_i1.p1 TRINITY_DN21600_c0_g1~~TRINITY_DN21600_c0_g1_i1.p1  ORF type:complete len:293 (+),score=21.11 TRINITY_DN21600_c0_g1_i1:123-1001(+)